MGIEYEQRITVNFPTVEAAEKVKRQAADEGMSPSKWIIQQLVRSLPDFGRFLLEQESVQINVNINIGETRGEGVCGVYIDNWKHSTAY